MLTNCLVILSKVRMDRRSQTFGDQDNFKLLTREVSSSEGLTTSTRAMQVSTGCVVQVTIERQNPDGSYALAVALTFVPGVVISEDLDGGGKVSSRRLTYSLG